MEELRLVLEKGVYSQVKEVYWNDRKVAGVMGVDVSFRGSEMPRVRIEVISDVVFGDAEPIRALVEFVTPDEAVGECRYCGTRVKDSDLKCPSCGAAVSVGC